MEKVFGGRKEKLLRVREMKVEDLRDYIGADSVIGFSRRGTLTKPEEWVSKYVKDNTIFVVGGFPRGGFSPDLAKKFNVMIAIHEMPLETHVVLARAIYDYERLRKVV